MQRRVLISDDGSSIFGILLNVIGATRYCPATKLTKTLLSQIARIYTTVQIADHECEVHFLRRDQFGTRNIPVFHLVDLFSLHSKESDLVFSGTGVSHQWDTKFSKN